MVVLAETTADDGWVGRCGRICGGREGLKMGCGRKNVLIWNTADLIPHGRGEQTTCQKLSRVNKFSKMSTKLLNFITIFGITVKTALKLVQACLVLVFYNEI